MAGWRAVRISWTIRAIQSEISGHHRRAGVDIYSHWYSHWIHPPCNVDTNKMLSLSASSYFSSPSNSQSESLMRTRMPGRLKSRNSQLVTSVMHRNRLKKMKTHTPPSTTNSSVRESFITFAQRYLTKYATVGGLPSSTSLVKERVCFVTLSNSISRPPL